MGLGFQSSLSGLTQPSIYIFVFKLHTHPHQMIKAKKNVACPYYLAQVCQGLGVNWTGLRTSPFGAYMK